MCYIILDSKKLKRFKVFIFSLSFKARKIGGFSAIIHTKYVPKKRIFFYKNTHFYNLKMNHQKILFNRTDKVIRGFPKFLNFKKPAPGYRISCFFMADKEKKLHTFGVVEKDTIRMSEQRHEALLRKQLLDYGISVDFEKITPHGFR